MCDKHSNLAKVDLLVFKIFFEILIGKSIQLYERSWYKMYPNSFERNLPEIPRHIPQRLEIPPLYPTNHPVTISCANSRPQIESASQDVKLEDSHPPECALKLSGLIIRTVVSFPQSVSVLFFAYLPQIDSLFWSSTTDRSGFGCPTGPRIPNPHSLLLWINYSPVQNTCSVCVIAY